MEETKENRQDLMLVKESGLGGATTNKGHKGSSVKRSAHSLRNNEAYGDNNSITDLHLVNTRHSKSMQYILKQ